MNQSNEIKTKAFSGAIWKFLERLSAQAVSMIVAIILARILQPADYSVVSIVSVFFAFANVFISSGFNVALMQKKEVDPEAYSSALFLNLGIAAVLYGALFCFAPAIANLYRNTLLIPVIRVMGLILPINGVKSIVCAYISCTLQFRKFFFATIGGTLASAAAGISMAYLGFGPWALVAQQMVSALIHTVILWFSTGIPLACRISLEKAAALFHYGWRVVVSSIIDVAYKQINPLFIGLRYSGTDLTFYTKGKSFPELISGICSNTLSAVLFPVLSKFQDDREQLNRGLRRFNKTASFFVFPALFGLFAVADTFVALVLTEKWMPAAAYIRIFCLSEMVMSVEAGNREALKAIGRNDIFLKYEIIKKVFFFGIIGLCMAVTGSPVALALSAIGCGLVVFTISVVINSRFLDYAPAEQCKDLLPNFICAVVMCASVLWAGTLPLAPWLKIIIQVGLGAVVYILCCILIRNENLAYCWNRIRPAAGRCLRPKGRKKGEAN